MYSVDTAMLLLLEELAQAEQHGVLREATACMASSLCTHSLGVVLLLCV